MKNNIHSVILFVMPLLFFAVSPDKAAEFELKNLKNRDIKLSQLLEEGPVLLDFWATWCKPCIKAMPKLNELQKKYGNGLTVVGINEDGNRSQAKIRPFVQSLNVSFEILLDHNNEVMRKMGVQVLPTTLLLGADGTIISRHTGYGADKVKQLEEEIKVLLETTEHD